MLDIYNFNLTRQLDSAIIIIDGKEIKGEQNV